MKRNMMWMLLISLMVMALLVGCTGNNTPSPSPNTDQTPGMSPGISPMVSTSPDANGSAMPQTSPGASPDTSSMPGNIGEETVNDEKTASAIVAEVEKLSEVDRANVIVVGDVALVGVEFTGQYQGGVTERINEMVTQRVQGVKKDITRVIVTNDETQLGKIEELAKRVGEDIGQDFKDILERIEKAI